MCYSWGKKKNQVCVFINNSGLSLLTFLWLNGLIYGYRKDGFKVTIYLKVFSGRGVFSNLFFLGGKKKSLANLKKLAVLNNNDFYFLMGPKGVLSINECIRLKIGGYLLGKF